MIRYWRPNAKPRGRMYHGPGSLKRLWIYHRANSLRGIRYAAKAGYQWIDLDGRRTATRGVWVGSHSDDAQGKEGFHARGVPRRVIRHLTWPQIARMVTERGYRIQRLERLFAEAARCGIGVALDIKTRMSDEDADAIVAAANRYKVRLYGKYDDAKPWLVVAADRLHKRGVWTRPNGSTKWRRPA